MYLIVGLGNPGKKYEKTRHNAGFLAVNFLVEENANWSFNKKVNAEVIKQEDNIFAKPQTFMNESGKAVRSLADYYKIPSENIIIIYDEIDLPLGEIRVRDSGSSAGHNGIKSIIQHLGAKNFTRIRIGIRNDKTEKMDAAKFVLKKFSRKEFKELQESVLPKVKNKIEELI